MEKICILLIFWGIWNSIYHQKVFEKKINTSVMSVQMREIRVEVAPNMEMWETCGNQLRSQSQKTFICLKWQGTIVHFTLLSHLSGFYRLQPSFIPGLWTLIYLHQWGKKNSVTLLTGWRDKKEMINATNLRKPFDTATHKTFISKSRKLKETATG